MKKLSTLYDNNYVHFAYEAETSFLLHKWKAKTELASWQDIKAVFNEYIEILKVKSPKFFFVNLKEFRYIITPEQQEWVDKNIHPLVLNEGKNRIAMLTSTDLFAQVSTEQLVGEEHGKKLNVKFFDDEEKAKKWLLEEYLLPVAE
jgi:hypothetical protein